MNIFLIIIYYIIFIYILKRKKKLIYKIIIVIISLIFLINNGRIVNNEVSILDVGQGDSSLIRLKNKNILIDTGGNINYDISKNILIPYFKSVGIKKIDYLVLTQGHLVLCTRNYLKKTNQLSLILSKSCSIWSIYSYQNNLLCFLSNLL